MPSYVKSKSGRRIELPGPEEEAQIQAGIAADPEAWQLPAAPLMAADLSGFSQDELDAVAWQLNTRPRKSLGWKCPAELFMPNDFSFERHYYQLVALRT
jgi:hypothetical protein